MKIKKNKKKARSHANELKPRPQSAECFLCFQNGNSYCTNIVNFAWPGSTSATSTIDAGQKNDIYVQAMQAIQDAVYQRVEKWKRWLWCYEILNAEEIKVSRKRLGGGSII